MPIQEHVILNGDGFAKFFGTVRGQIEAAFETELFKQRHQNGFGRIVGVEKLEVRKSGLLPYFTDETVDSLTAALRAAAAKLRQSAYTASAAKVYESFADRVQQRFNAHNYQTRRRHFVAFAFRWFVEDLIYSHPFPQPDADITFVPLVLGWSIEAGKIVLSTDPMVDGDIVVDLPFPTSLFADHLTPVLNIAKQVDLPVQLATPVADAKAGLGIPATITLVDMQTRGNPNTLVGVFDVRPRLPGDA
jgi:hypothetical protein